MKNKGFTLIELLAVIVILAIISVIAIPRILNVVEEAKKSSAVSSALGYIDAVEKQIMINATSKKHSEIIDGTYPAPLSNEYGVTVKGKEPTMGEIIVSKGKVTEAQLLINGYSVTCQNDRCTVTGTSAGLISLTIKTMPTKTTYADSNELLDLTGLQVQATYGSGTKKILNAEEMTVSPSNNTKLTKIGENTITISYTDHDVTKTTSFNVTLEKLHFDQSSSNTFGYNGYNNNLNSYATTARINGYPSNARDVQYIILPEGAIGGKLNIKFANEGYYASWTVMFGDEDGNRIGNFHWYGSSSHGRTKGSTFTESSVSTIMAEDVYPAGDYDMHTGVLDIPDNTNYISFFRYYTEHGGRIFDVYVTAQ